MAEQEGVIKYQLLFHECEAMVDHNFDDLNHWHSKFKLAGILGQDPDRYQGLGFGNLSQRIDIQAFLISGTQTGYLDHLSAEDYALVTHTDIENNCIEAEGLIKPSSESLTHAAIYALDDGIQFVFHVHSPKLWRERAKLGIAQTEADIEYGTPAMAEEIKRLRDAGGFQQGNILAMVGHEDGIISFGATANDAGNLIMQALDKVNCQESLL